MRITLFFLLIQSLLFADTAKILGQNLQSGIQELLANHPGQSGALTLERGELSLLTRAWVADNAVHTIDVQYFIWSADNVGRLAMDGLLRAANRGQTRCTLRPGGRRRIAPATR